MNWATAGPMTLLICMLSAVCTAAPLTLVRDGQPTSIIVIAENPTGAARNGAEELQGWIQKVSGAKIPIISERKIPPEQTSPVTYILVGDSERAAALGMRSAGFELEEVQIRTFPGALVIMGDDARPDGVPLSGTLWAIEVFAEQILGIRVLWPGPLGEVVPKQRTITVNDINFRFVPALRKRGIRNLGYSERVQRGLDKLGWKAEDYKRHCEESRLWFRFHRIGGSFEGHYGHAFGQYWERFHKKHPDWFALQPDGTRDNSRAKDRARLCKSNRGLIEQVAKEAIEQLRAHPTWDTVSISPNDGGPATFCLCESCKAWDAPDGEVIESWGPNGPIKHVSLTDRFVKFYSAVAEIVAKECPDRYLGAYAYSAYSLPPVRAKLHPNVVIGFVGFGYLNEERRQKARESWLKWSQAAKRLFLRPNLLGAGMGFPTVYVHALAEDLRFCAEHGMMLTDFDCCYQNWATDGLNYYVLAKLLWDMKTDVDAIIADYCSAGFGPAAEPIQKYFARIEAMTTEFAKTNVYEGRKKNHHTLAACYTDNFLAECNRLLDEAEQKAGDEAIVRERIGFLRKGMEYARLLRDCVMARAALQAGDSEAAKRLKDAEAACDAWYQQLGISWAINAPCQKFYGY